MIRFFSNARRRLAPISIEIVEHVEPITALPVRLVPSPLDALSPRQKDALKTIMLDLKAAARKLEIAPSTLRIHRAALYDRLGSRVQIIARYGREIAP